MFEKNHVVLISFCIVFYIIHISFEITSFARLIELLHKDVIPIIILKWNPIKHISFVEIVSLLIWCLFHHIIRVFLNRLHSLHSSKRLDILFESIQINKFDAIKNNDVKGDFSIIRSIITSK